MTIFRSSSTTASASLRLGRLREGFKNLHFEAIFGTLDTRRIRLYISPHCPTCKSEQTIVSHLGLEWLSVAYIMGTSRVRYSV